MKGQLILIPGRSSKQGVGLNKGKLKEEYIRVTTTVELRFQDAQEIGVDTADRVKISNHKGKTEAQGKVINEGK